MQAASKAPRIVSAVSSVPALKRAAAEIASRPVVSVPPADSLIGALSILADKGYGALAVKEESDGHRRTDFAGIITERDFLKKTALDGSRYSMLDAPVSSLMTAAEEVTFAEPDWTLAQCLERMLKGGFRHLPLIENKKCTGMLSSKDIVKAIVEDDKFSSKWKATVGGVAMSMVARTQDATIASVERGSTVADAVRSMREQRVGSVLIPTAGQTLSESLHSFGIFTERDYLKLLAKSAADGNDYRQTLVAEVMTPAESMIWVEPNLPAIDALHLMATKGMRHLPVRKPYDWLYRPGMPLKKGFILAPEAPALLAVVSMRELVANVLKEY